MLFVSTVTVIFLVAGAACSSSEEEGTTFEVGPEGSVISFERFALEVPANVVPEPTTIRIIERGNLGPELAAQLDPDKYIAIGPSYEIETALRTHEGMPATLFFEADEPPEGFDPEHLSVFTWSDAIWEPDPAQPPAPGTLPEQTYSPRPVDVDVDGGTVGFHVFGRTHVQLVALADPIRVSGAMDGPASASQAKATGAQQAPLVITPGPWVILMPEITAAYDDTDEAFLMGSLRDALEKSHSTMSGQGFPVPPIHTLTIVAKKLPAGTWGQVRPIEPRVIAVDPLQAKGVLNSLVAHEFFHVVQNWCTNVASVVKYHLPDRWFIEGGAEWARDTVYDGVVGHYVSPPPERLKTPLNTPSEQPSEPEAHLYQTVVFWKWLEARYPSTLAAMIFQQRVATHAKLGSMADIQNTAEVSWMDSFKVAQPAVAFHQFFEDALWNKDFDTDEQGTGDLWDTLGAPKTLAEAYRKEVYTLQKDGSGDGKENIEEVLYLVDSHLAAEGFLIKNSTGDAALQGTLHLKFAPTSPELFAAAVIHGDALQSKMDLSSGEEVEVRFGDGDEVFVLVSDPRFLPAKQDQTSGGLVEVWVESGCGAPPTPDFRVSSADDFVQAIADANEGDVILLEAGTYTFDERIIDAAGAAAFRVDKSLTLMGAGAGQTTIRVDDQYAYPLIYTLDGTMIDRVTFRDFSFVTTGATRGGFVADGVRHLTFCGVDMTFGSAVGVARSWGISIDTLDAGAYKVELIDSSLQGPGSSYQYVRGLDIITAISNQSVEVVIANSTISGWDNGVEASAGEGNTLDFDIDDCSSTFSDNNQNVRAHINGVFLEICP